jgi:hypothetical protein
VARSRWGQDTFQSTVNRAFGVSRGRARSDLDCGDSRPCCRAGGPDSSRNRLLPRPIPGTAARPGPRTAPTRQPSHAPAARRRARQPSPARDTPQTRLILERVPGSSPAPQWSPPRSSGTTILSTTRVRLVVPPQWSPPRSSGTTSRSSVMPGRDRPQWSPPRSSGTTRARQAQLGRERHAAMEPRSSGTTARQIRAV